MSERIHLKIDETDGLPLKERVFAVLSIAFALCMSVLDVNIMNVVLPTLSHDFGTTPSMTTWIVNIYQLAIVISLLSFSALGEIWGYRKVYLSGIFFFCITSLICALSGDFLTLTVARFFQGLSAAALTSVNTAQLRYIYPKNKLARGMAINAMIVAISAAAGPTVAGAILSIASWHWLFAINIPLGLISLVLGMRYLPRLEIRNKHRFDYVSSIANALFFGLLIYSLEGFAHKGTHTHLFLSLTIVAVIGAFYIHRELHQKSPLLPLDLLRIPIFSLSIVTSICSFSAQMLAMVSLPFFFQDTLGYNEVLTGMLLTSWPLTTLFAAPLAGVLSDRIHPGILGSIGMTAFFIGLVSLSFIDANTQIITIVPRLMLCGFGFGFFQTPNNGTIISSAPPKRSGGASGMLGMARLLGQTTGTTMVALLFGMIISPERGAVTCLLVGAVFAFLAAVISSLRLSQPSTLKRK